MSEPFIVELFGPDAKGRYQWSEQSGADYYTSQPDDAELERATVWLTEALDTALDAGIDWDLRGDDEIGAMLEELRLAGTAMLAALTSGKYQAEIAELLGRADIVSSRTGRHNYLEFLYLGHQTDAASVHRFLGARAVVGRKYETPPRPGPVGSASLIKESPWKGKQNGRTVGLAQDRRLASARSGSEHEMFVTKGFKVRTLDPIDADEAGRKAIGDFIAGSTFLTHFNAHAAQSIDRGKGVRTAALYVSNEFELDVDGIRELQVDRGSMVFLNCCDAITINFGRGATIAEAFARKGPQVIVATSAKIEDLYASQWASHFYEALSGGLEVWEAILKARRAMLHKDGNPMAFLYSYLGRHRSVLPGTSKAA